MGQSGRWQRSRGAAERQGDWQSGGVSPGTAEQAASTLIEYLSQLLARLLSHQIGLFSLSFSVCGSRTVCSKLRLSSR